MKITLSFREVQVIGSQLYLHSNKTNAEKTNKNLSVIHEDCMYVHYYNPSNIFTHARLV